MDSADGRGVQGEMDSTYTYRAELLCCAGETIYSIACSSAIPHYKIKVF